MLTVDRLFLFPSLTNHPSGLIVLGIVVIMLIIYIVSFVLSLLRIPNFDDFFLF